jgi:hypothetical protein
LLTGQIYSVEENSMDPKQKAWGKVVARAWSDELFKTRLLADPKTVLKENGIEVPADVTFKVVEDSGKTIHLILPERPAELSEAELEQVAGGVKGADLIAEAMAYKPTGSGETV